MTGLTTGLKECRRMLDAAGIFNSSGDLGPLIRLRGEPLELGIRQMRQLTETIMAMPDFKKAAEMSGFGDSLLKPHNLMMAALESFNGGDYEPLIALKGRGPPQ